MPQLHPARQWTIVTLAVFVVGCHPAAHESSTEITTGKTDTVNILDQLVVDASCGECQFGLPGDGCDLAVRIDGKVYYVDGSSMEDHGDAHGVGGLCNFIRQAKVTGKVENDRFVPSSFELLPFDKGRQRTKPRLGISIAMKGDELVIADVLADSPAEEAGLRTGDVLVTLNDTSVTGIERSALQSIIADNPTVRFSVIRDEIQLEILVRAAE